jgi:adhesin transport system outer membrane protein
MKKLNKTVITSFVLAMSASTALAQSMTLNDVITKTLETHPEYKQSEQLVESARQGVVQAKAGYLPKVDVALGAGYERVENQSTISRQTASPSRSDHADSDRKEASLTITQMVFDGFATPARVEQAKADLENQMSYSKEIAEKVAVLAARAYYDVVREQTNLVIDEQNLAMHKNYQSQIQRRVRSGKSNRADLEQVNSRVALAESQVVQRMELVEQAKAEFFRQVGIEANELAANEVDFSVVPSSLEEAIEIAYAANPRLQSVSHAKKSAESSIKEAKAAYMPRVDLEMSATRNQNVDGVDKKDHSEQAMLRMRYNLFNGGADKARHLASIAEDQAAEQNLEDTKRAVARDVRAAWFEYQLTTKRLASLTAQVKAAKATKIAYKSQFDVGQRTLLDVLDSEREYNSARTTFESARNSRDYSVYQLLSLMGKLTDTFAGKEVVLVEEDFELIDPETNEVAAKVEAEVTLEEDEKTLTKSDEMSLIEALEAIQ